MQCNSWCGRWVDSPLQKATSWSFIYISNEMGILERIWCLGIQLIRMEVDFVPGLVGVWIEVTRWRRIVYNINWKDVEVVSKVAYRIKFTLSRRGIRRGRCQGKGYMVTILFNFRFTYFFNRTETLFFYHLPKLFVQPFQHSMCLSHPAQTFSSTHTQLDMALL